MTSRRSVRSSRRGGGRNAPPDLFETHTVEQVRVVEKEKKKQIEEKQQELRQLVGARYRDLIEAADHIVDMHTKSVGIVDSIAGLHERHSSLLAKVEGPRDNTAVGYAEQKKAAYALAGQLKLAMDTPEHIWAALEGADFRRATQLYVVAENIQLSLEGDAAARESVASRFPLMARHWDVVAQFPAKIVEQSRDRLRNPVYEGWEYTDALAAVAVLERRSTEDLLEHFLTARFERLCEYFDAAVDDVAEGVDRREAAAAATAGAVCVLQRTLRHVYSLFMIGVAVGSNEPTDPADDEDSNGGGESGGGFIRARHSALTSALTKGVNFDARLAALYGSVATSLHRYLPDGVRTLERQREGDTPEWSDLDLAVIRTSTRQWLERCEGELAARFEAGSPFVELLSSGDVIAAAEEGGWLEASKEASSLAEGLLTADGAAGFHEIVYSVVGGDSASFSVWEKYFNGLFVERAKSVAVAVLGGLALRPHVDRVLDSTEADEANYTTTTTTTHAVDASVGEFVWLRNTHSGVGGGGGSSVDSKEVVAKKARGLTHAVDEAFGSFEGAVAAATASVRALFHLDTDKESVPFPASFSENVVAVKAAARVDGLREICGMLERVEASVRVQAANVDDAGDEDETIKTHVFLGRVAAAAAAHSVAFPKLTELLADISATPKRRAGGRVKPGTQEWASVRERLESVSSAAFEGWVRALSLRLSDTLANSLTQGYTTTAVAQSAAWPEITLAEATEDGDVHTTIKLPYMVSGALGEFLYGAAKEVYTAVGHTLSDSVAIQLRASLLNGAGAALRAAAETLGDDVANTAACQLLFDATVLSSLMVGSDLPREVVREAESMLSDVGTVIDPVDMVVYGPHIDTRAAAFCSRNSLLLGALRAPVRDDDDAGTTPTRSFVPPQPSKYTAPVADAFSFLLVSQSVQQHKQTLHTATTPRADDDRLAGPAAGASAGGGSGTWGFVESVRKFW